MNRMILTGLLVGLFGWVSLAFSRSNENHLPSLQEVLQAIEKQGAHWSAEETSVSQLSPEERRALCGDRTALTLASPFASQGERFWRYPGQPERFDWRDVDGQNWMTPIRNQGGCGSCAAFAAIGAMEGMADIYYGDPYLNLNLSEQHIFSCGCGSCCETGWTVAQACDYLLDAGAPEEGCFPYTGRDIDCSWTCDDWQSRARHISCWNWAGGTSNVTPPAEIKEKLMEGPLATSMMVYSDFNYYGGGVYQHVTGGEEAMHGIVIVGWDDTTNPPSWICKNSWGIGWGEAGGGQIGGWFRIAMGTNHCGIEERVIFQVMGDLPDIQISETFHDFGAVDIGDTAEWNLPIFNNGQADLIVQNIDFYYGEYGLKGNGLPLTIGAGQTTPLTFVFTPTNTDIQAGIAKMSTNDCHQPVHDIRLFGWGLNVDIVSTEVTDACGLPGERASVSFELDNQKYKNISCSLVDIVLSHDPALLSLAGVTPTQRTQDLDFFEWHESAPGTLAVTMMGTSGNVIEPGTGPVATLLFDISQAAQFGQYSDITTEDLNVLDAEGDPVQTETEDGFVGVYCRGDVNLDGNTNVLDMIRAINFILSVGDPPTEFELWAADCSGDEQINVLDVLGIANVILGQASCQP